MKKLLRRMIFISLLPVAFSCHFGEKEVPVCRIEGDKVIYRLDREWDSVKIKEISYVFGLDSVTLKNAFEGKRLYKVNGGIWRTRRIGPRFIDLSRPLINMSDTLTKNGFVFMISSQLENFQPVRFLSDTYGTNVLFSEKAFSYSSGKACFWLPGNNEASVVYLSGSFNNWSTSATEMVRADSGWTASIKLEPGKYSYKYIIDGRWTPDPLNSLKEDDMNGGFNSVIYCPNYTFRLKGRVEAKDVCVTGAFLNWDPAGLKMKRTADGWELPVYLKEGTYSYKFIADHEWLTDPGNPDSREDGKGNMNSFISVGDQHTFILKGFGNAAGIVLAGTFNNWRPDELMMSKTDDGWKISVALPAGNYEYKFIVDGKWITDPLNENTTGSGDFINSILCFKPNHVFALEGHQEAKEVMVTGSFNSFSNPGYRMSRIDGEWIIPVYLNPGKTLYKFIVDGVWLLDPGNELWEENEFGTGNSVLWIEPD